MTPSSPLFFCRTLAYHQLACPTSGYCLRRHNALLRCFAGRAAAAGGYTCVFDKSLQSSGNSRRSVDALLTALHHTPSRLAFDACVTMLLLPSYVEVASRDPSRVLDTAASDKAKKHAAGCLAAGRAYLTLAFSALGALGPDETLAWTRSVFDVSAAYALMHEGSAASAVSSIQLMFVELNAIMACGNYDMLSEHTADLDAPPAPKPLHKRRYPPAAP